MRSVGAILEAVISLSIEAAKPVANDRGACIKESGCGLDADLLGFLDHLVAPG